MTERAGVCEIFSGIQGEGSFVGHRQIFLRLSGCDLSCEWCDTKKEILKTARIETHVSSRQFTEFVNPVSTEEVIHVIKILNDSCLHHSLSITGGEPLLHSEFLKALLNNQTMLDLRKSGLKNFLETGGHRFEEFSVLRDFFDIISMDVKLPSSLNGKELWDEHRNFIEYLPSAEKCFSYIKIVVTRKTGDNEFLRACELITNSVVKELIIQPVTSEEKTLQISPDRVLELQELSINFLKSNKAGHVAVRVIPQVHKLIDQL